MTPNDYGKIAQNEWVKTADIRDNVKLHTFVVMPNHVHGILEIINCYCNRCRGVAGNALNPIENARNTMSNARNTMSNARNTMSNARNTMSNARNTMSNARNTMSNARNTMRNIQNTIQGVARNAPTFMSNISPKCGTLSTIIRAYKSAVSKQIHDTGFIGSVWQRNFHEHVIRNEQEYQNKAKYIVSNTENWQKDKFYTVLSLPM